MNEQLLDYETVLDIVSCRRYRFWMDGKTPMVDDKSVEYMLDNFYAFVSSFGLTDPPTLRRAMTQLCKEHTNGNYDAL